MTARVVEMAVYASTPKIVLAALVRGYSAAKKASVI
jgi:hypothetical protein